MNMKLKTTLIATVLLLSTASTQAAFVETDWNTTGDARATLHEETGLEWLDLSETNNMSINEVQALLDTTYSGWRLPTRSEVSIMMNDIFSEATITEEKFNKQVVISGYHPSLYSNHLFLQTIGHEVSRMSRGQYINDQYGQREYENSSYNVIFSGMYYGNTSTNTYMNIAANSAFTGAGEDFHQSQYGVYLVSDGGTTLSSQLDPSINANNAAAPINDVSAPTIMGGLFTLLGLVAIRRRSSDTSKSSK
jgi:hypothetical protein